MSVGYITLTRQNGLLNEMRAIANNVANISTTGFRREGVIFSEYIKQGVSFDAPSISMATARVKNTDFSQATVGRTGGSFDFAIEGPGFFQIDTPDGLRLTRAGAFTPNEGGELVNPDGYRLLDAGGAPVFVPFDAKSVALAPDGTLSADGRPITQLGVVSPADPGDLVRSGGVLFEAQGDLLPVENATILQGYVEGSNVDPILEIARMIEVQRAYEIGQQFLNKESDRKDSVIRTLAE